MTISETICKHCGSRDLIEDEETGEIICAGCGLVVSEVSLLRRDYIEEDSKIVKGSVIPPSTQQKMKRLMVLDHRLRVDAEDSYVIRVATQEINRLIQTLHLPDSVEKNADSIYRQAQKDGLVLRGTISGFAAASVYAACRVQGLPRTLRDISEASPEDLKDIARMYRIILAELNISVELDNPLKHLNRIASEVEASTRAEMLAADILIKAIKADHHTGKNPKGMAASSLYIACKKLGEKCTQINIAKAAGVSSLTIRKRVKGLQENVDVDALLDEELVYSTQ